LFTNVTRVPGDTVTSVGLTPDDVIVTRVVWPEPGAEDGDEGELPPQAAITIPRTRATQITRANRPAVIPRPMRSNV
jgi:hypothetical protein